MTTPEDFIKEYGITLEADRIEARPDDCMDSDMFHWRVILKRGNQTMALYYSMGYGHVEDRNGQKVHNMHWDAKLKAFVPSFGRVTVYDVKDAQRKHGYRPARPQLPDILESLASDASSYDSARNFEEWAGEYGYDTDSRKAHAIYTAIAEQAKELKHFLGAEGYNVLLYGEPA